MGAILKRITFSAVLVGLAGWLLVYSWQGREATLKLFDHTVEAAERLRIFPKVQNEIGYQLWFQNRTDEAMALFNRAIAEDIYQIDAWLRMGEIEYARGNTAEARAILRFVERLTQNVYRWKWREAMLTQGLGMDEIFVKNINHLIPFDRDRQNALFVLDQAFDNSTEAVLNVLAPGNKLFYFDWLMQWRRVGDAQIMWEAVSDSFIKTPEITLQFIHFLLSNHEIKAAKSVWEKLGIHNPAFENEMAQKGFGWRSHNPGNGAWNIKRTVVIDIKSDYILQVVFAGEQNIHFHHLYQIVPVVPKTSYRLTYQWRSQSLTTEQRPFIEIYGHECKNLYAKSDMIEATSVWREGAISFDVPETCEAMVVRLRRLPSKRFDSKIKGKVWLDYFLLEEMKLGQ